MTFEVAARAYDRFMGRFSQQLSAPLCDLAGVEPGQRAVDVGAGPGALTGELVRRLGADHVDAVDPSEPFTAALTERYPGVGVHRTGAEELPFGDDRFDVALSQLVVAFMSDPARGVAEMVRVTRPGGRVALASWDYAGGRAPVSPYWRGARVLGEVPNADDFTGGRMEHLLDLLTGAGLTGVRTAELASQVDHDDFASWWEPFTLGVGPAGAHCASLTPEEREQVREGCRAELGDGPVALRAVAWAAVADVP
jgi:SAM-dependent methyltransferase